MTTRPLPGGRAVTTQPRHCEMTHPLLVTTGHGRSKNGVASLAYDPVVHADARRTKQNGGSPQADARMDCRVKPGNDEMESAFANVYAPEQRVARMSGAKSGI